MKLKKDTSMKKVLIVLVSCSAVAGCGTYNIPSTSNTDADGKPIPVYKGTYSTNAFDEVASGTIIAPDGTEIPATSASAKGDEVTLKGTDASGNTVTLTGGGCT